MATPARARLGPLDQADWIKAASARLAREGIEEVRVEVLARDLGVSKGSFYWHFRDRADLLDRMLEEWEASETAWLDERASHAGTANRWAKLIERSCEAARIRTEVAIRDWARADERVAVKVAIVERKRANLIAEVLREVGFSLSAAQAWSELVSLVRLGWMERATRDRQFQFEGRGLGELLSDVVLAASTRSAATR